MKWLKKISEIFSHKQHPVEEHQQLELDLPKFESNQFSQKDDPFVSDDVVIHEKSKKKNSSKKSKKAKKVDINN